MARTSGASYAIDMGWNVDGVSEDRFLALLYNEPSETLVAHFAGKVGLQPVNSVYVRHRTETTYRKVSCGDEYAFAATPVCVAKAPRLFFIVTEPNRRGEPPWGWNAGRMVRHNLATGESTVVIDAEAFGKRHGGAWLSKLLSSSDDGSTLICVLATVALKYFIARLDVATSAVEPLAPLNTPFF